MRTRKLGIILAVCVILSFAQPSLAAIATTVLAIWDFGPDSTHYTQAPAYYNTVAAPTLTLAGSGVDTNGKNGVAYTDAAGIAHIAGQAAAWDDINKSGTVNDAALFITLDTTGFSSLAIRWDYKSEFATSFDFAYRTAADGTWTQIADNQTITPNWSGESWGSVVLTMFDKTALNNQSYVQFRIDDMVEGPGNDRFAFDNIEITGVVPEPTTLLLLGLGAMLLKKTKHS
jgi:hypothetical protein